MAQDATTWSILGQFAWNLDIKISWRDLQTGSITPPSRVLHVSKFKLGPTKGYVQTLCPGAGIIAWTFYFSSVLERHLSVCKKVSWVSSVGVVMAILFIVLFALLVLRGIAVLAWNNSRQQETTACISSWIPYLCWRIYRVWWLHRSLEPSERHKTHTRNRKDTPRAKSAELLTELRKGVILQP